MPSEEAFEEFVETQLLPELARLREDVRAKRAERQSRRLSWRAKAAIWAVGAGVVYLVPNLSVLFIVIFVPALIDRVRMWTVRIPGPVEAKHRLVRQVLRFLNPGFAYFPHIGIRKREFIASGLVTPRFDTYRSEDLVMGKHGATAFRFSEVKAESSAGTEEDQRWVTVFDGLFLVADFNKHFEHPLYVLPDATEKYMGVFARAFQSVFQGDKGELVQLENPEFERCFKVYGRDPVEARYLLSPSFMRRLVRFRESRGSWLALCFRDDQLYLALPLATDLFRVDDIDALDPEVFRGWARDIAFVTGILDELDLETRIWSKA